VTGPLLWLDVETTGLNQEKHGIVSLAAIADFDGQLIEASRWNMNPEGREVEDSALAVNGFSREQIAGFPNWKDIAAEFSAWVLKIYTLAFVPVPVGGFNHISFDCRFIREWLSASDMPRFEERFKADEQFDVMLLVKRDITGRFDKIENRKLTTIAAAMGVPLEKAHDASEDIRATRELYYRIMAGEGPKT